MQETVNNIRQDLANRIRVLRKSRGLTQEDLARAISQKTGIAFSGNAVSSWENGKNSLSIERLFLIAEILDYPLTAFFPSDRDTSQPEQASAAAYMQLNEEDRAKVEEFIHFLIWQKKEDTR